MKNTVFSALSQGFTHPVRDPLWGHIYLRPALAGLLDAAPFMRLGRIFQLGPVFLVYPGATHTRASHSIGVYHIGRRLLQNLAERGADGWLSAQGVSSFLCACLLHDLGHFPYAHSLKELPLACHESLSAQIMLKEPLKSLVGKTGAEPTFAAAIVDKEMPLPKGAGGELLFYRKLLSGCLDPDKLDYLNRDARYCGVPYGAQDVDFILSRLHPHKQRGADIDSRLIPNVEAVLFSKYLMYRSVYWHRQVRAATAMVKKALIEGLQSGRLAGGELYGLEDQSLFAILECTGSEGLVKAIREGSLYETLCELPFNRGAHAKLLDLKGRGLYEEKIEERLRAGGMAVKAGDVIIDIPEPISFETGLYVRDEHCYFAQSSSAFNAKIVDSFVRSLYTLRVFIKPKFEKKPKAKQAAAEILGLAK
ncbi:MAG: HD domain-containing protein [Spirochaetes bacterium]|nr:HD domain-containing protein [Spirochaetota bacterium]